MAESLKYIKQQLSDLLTLFDYTIIGYAGSPPRNQINGANNIRNIVRRIIGLNLFDDVANKLVTSAIFNTAANEVVVLTGEADSIKYYIELLKDLIINLKSVLDHTVPNESPESINIKLPSGVDDFEKLAKISTEINFSISQPLLNSDIEVNTKIASVENGSIWLNVFVGGITGLAFIEKYIKSAIVIRKEKYNGDLFKEQARELKMKNDSINLNELEKGIDIKEKEVVEEEAKKIQAEYFTNNNSPEDLERLKASLNTLADLFSKGILILPSKTADKDAVKNFPTVSEILLLENKTKEIEGPQE